MISASPEDAEIDFITDQLSQLMLKAPNAKARKSRRRCTCRWARRSAVADQPTVSAGHGGRVFKKQRVDEINNEDGYAILHLAQGLQRLFHG